MKRRTVFIQTINGNSPVNLTFISYPHIVAAQNMSRDPLVFDRITTLGV